jgi:two-component system NtrC family sensor kinase
MGFPLNIEKLRSLFWKIFLLVTIPVLSFFILGFLKPRHEELPWLFFSGILYILLLFFLFFYLRLVFSRENITAMAEISSIAEDIQAEKLASLETLTAGIAHEINNPIGIIMGYCGLVLEKIDPQTQFYKDVKTIERQGLNCKQIVENLLNFTRPKPGPEDTVDLNSTIEKLLILVGPGLKAQGIFWNSSLLPELPPAPGNVQKWQQILLNLINNAKTAMPSGGRLKIWTSTKNLGKTIELGFQDNGIGIPKEYLNRIFDPFFTTKKEGRGIGLGLSITYGIIINYGGFITCQSRTKETPSQPKGTTFRISVPSVQALHDF